ncbi:MAG: thioredoxin family protein [Bacteroidota bacterium]|nr:thioredoxin family protein [Bacteroidota bacterium]
MKNIFLKLFILLFMVVPFISIAQEKNKMVYDNESEKNILIGAFNQQSLKDEICSEWYIPEYDNYVVDDMVLEDLELIDFQNSVINIIMGTWCSDSQREIPRFYKILEYLEFDMDNVKSIAVDRNKEAPGMQISRLNIEKVPTFIFYLDNKEIGRIIESPENSLEHDIVKMYLNK